MKDTTQQLALFGKNRYHDWVIFLFAATIIIVASIAYDTALYLGTKDLISQTTQVVPIPSKFGNFREQVDMLTTHINGGIGTSTPDIPIDPSLR
jgi:hypothetical protein